MSVTRISRRSLLARATGWLATAMWLGYGGRGSAAGSNPPPARDADLLNLSAVDAVQAMRAGDLTAERYASVLLARCQAGARLNAFITLQPDRVLEAARDCDLRRRKGARLGMLHGLPIPIKDSLNTAQYPTTAGTPALRHFQPREDAPIVHALRSAGAIVLGKTNLHELSYGYTSNNHAYGTIRNPYDPTCIPGGSSGGTGAAIGYRMAPLGIAEDTEGSIRVPAALCGVAGFRPTTGRYPTVGAVPITPLFDQAGPHARTVADLLLFDSAVTGELSPSPPVALQGVRLGVVRRFWYTDLDPETERITAAALQRLQRAGVELIEGDLPELPHLISLITDPVQNHDVRPSLTRYLARYRTGVSFAQLLAQASPDVRVMIEAALPGGSDFVPEEQYQQAVKVHLPALHALYRDYFTRTGVQAIVFPTTILPAPKIGEETMEVVVRGRRMPLDQAMSRNIAPGSTAGLPGLVLPAGLSSDGLPIALEFDGPAASDRALLRLGLGLEQVLGRLPPPREL
ncbi:MAG TPA: amidase family protein [Steroidobacteraceae bacterium]|nr:amidase family protein [Steroidobacteraceae bacterium]